MSIKYKQTREEESETKQREDTIMMSTLETTIAWAGAIFKVWMSQATITKAGRNKRESKQEAKEPENEFGNIDLHNYNNE